jgi:predicted NBD/HSP70 family sugar kinase
MSMPHAVRHINKIRALEALFRMTQLSRSDIARELGLTRSTASSIVSDLVHEGIVTEDEDDSVDRGARTGRPGVSVRLKPNYAVFLGADIGVGRLTVVALDLTATVIAQATRSFDLGQADPDTVVDELALLIQTVMGKLPTRGTVRGLNLTVPGLLDHHGKILRAPILRWSDVPIVEMLRSRLPDLTAIEAENDANAFAMAELYRAGTSAPSNAIYIFLDAGVGGAIVSHGQLLRGHDGFAGEIGHIFVGEQSFVPMSILPGSLESFVGREAVLARCRFHGGVAQTIEEFVATLIAKSPAATSTVADWSLYLGRGLATLTSAFDPAKIVLGGPIAALFPFGEQDVLASMRNHLLPSQPSPSIERSPIGAEGPAIGAAAILHRRMLSFDENIVFNGARSEAALEAGVRSSSWSRKWRGY